MNKPTQKNSTHLRVWHWINVVVISVSVITVCLNSTLLDKKDNVKFISEQLNSASIPLTTQQATLVARSLEEKVWDWHVYAGYFLAALLIYRVVGETLSNRDHQLANKIKNALLHYRQQQNLPYAKELLVKVSYLAFYALLSFMAISGLSIKFHIQLGISDNLVHSIKEVHELVMYPILIFIVVHIIGVVIAEKKNRPGLVSDMINGGKV
ncbi:cytochrome b/b6 domain-containing protein [Pedobacter ureilyticus]|uniref:Cytochrome b/b6 domain-containing protein n=1 Tax=Pedobacter ureilyticus TaxID=1393051 RepID=A0ABW9J8M8_9SPHI|nr:cytochrome b/b6 domain-containing protein [Pedobacter helvus]